MPKLDSRRYAPGQRSVYGGTIIDRGSDDPIRVIPSLCGRCQGYGRVGDELFCPVCKGAIYQNPADAYEPYYETSQGFNRSTLRATQQRAFADGAAQRAAAASATSASGVKTRSAGRKRSV